jgi:hypothetical protein
MRLIIIIAFATIIIILNSCNNSNQVTNDYENNQNLIAFCKLWGFLKYNHPVSGGGNLNWDSVLLKSMDQLIAINEVDSLKKFFDDFIPKGFSNDDSMSFCGGDSIVLLNNNIDWMSDTSVFSKNTIVKLRNISANGVHFDNKYISANQWVKNPIFDNDTSFNNTILPNKNVRLLSLFRYWNIINYYYPYKYLTDIPWNDVLNQYIPVFINASDTLSYHLAVCKLTAMINDNHGYTNSNIIMNFLGNRFLPVQFKSIEGKTIITEVYSDSLAHINNLQLGDIIVKIDGVTVEAIRDSLSLYFSGSNQTEIQHTISYYLSRSSNKAIKLTIHRNETFFTTISETYCRGILSNARLKNKLHNPVKKINENITYVDLSKLTYENVDSIFYNILDSKVLILDIRKNCKFILHNISSILFPKMFVFYSVTTPLYENPGLFCYSVGDMTGPEYENSNSYKGNIAIIINEETQSIGEFTTMSLMTHNNVKSFGSTTAGADGNVSVIYLPGNIKTYISSIGIYWPDGKLTQRIGISPDIIVSPTIESIKSKKDDALQKAIDYAKSITD